MFFLAINMVGTDFSMICQLFPHRARSEIKVSDEIQRGYLETTLEMLFTLIHCFELSEQIQKRRARECLED